MQKDIEQYNEKRYPTHIDGAVCPNDENIQIYPINGQRRKEYLEIKFYDKEPETEKK